MEDFSGYITHRAEVPAWNLILLHESGNSGRFKKITAIVFCSYFTDILRIRKRIRGRLHELEFSQKGFYAAAEKSAYLYWCPFLWL